MNKKVIIAILLIALFFNHSFILRAYGDSTSEITENNNLPKYIFWESLGSTIGATVGYYLISWMVGPSTDNSLSFFPNDYLALVLGIPIGSVLGAIETNKLLKRNHPDAGGRVAGSLFGAYVIGPTLGGILRQSLGVPGNVALTIFSCAAGSTAGYELGRMVTKK